DRRRRALSRAPPHGRKRLARGGVGLYGAQSQGEVLSPVAPGAQAARRGKHALVALHQCRRPRARRQTRRSHKMKRVFRLPGSRARIERELEEEFAFHLEGRIEDLMRDHGLTREAAEREARRKFGDYQAYRRQAQVIDDHIRQRTNRMHLFDAIRRETAHAARALLRAPSFSIIAVVTLALGLGASTTIFTLLDRVVL